MIQNLTNIENELITLSMDCSDLPVYFPYTVIAALNEMEKTECKVFLYCYRMVYGFKDRENITISETKIGDAIGATRKTVGRALTSLSDVVDNTGNIKHAFLTKKFRGFKKAYNISISLPGLQPEKIKKLSPESIEGYLFPVPREFFDASLQNNGSKAPLNEWDNLNIQMFFRICALYAQKDYSNYNLKQFIEETIRLRTIILPPIKNRVARLSPSLKKFHQLNIIKLHERGTGDDFIFNAIQPELKDCTDFNTTPKPQTTHVEPNITHAKPQITHVEPNITHVVHLNPKPNITHAEPSITRVKPNITHIEPNITQAKPENAHKDFVVVVSLKNTTTEDPCVYPEKFIFEIDETKDLIQGTMTEAINHSMNVTNQTINDKNKYSAGLRRKAKAGVVINGDGASFFELNCYLRFKINEYLKEKASKPCTEITNILRKGMIPVIQFDEKTRYIQKINEDVMIMSAGEAGEEKESVYGNDVSILLTKVISISEIKKRESMGIMEIIQKALIDNKKVDLFSKNKSLIKIVDCVGETAITVVDGENGHLDFEEYLKLIKPSLLGGSGYQMRINGRFLNDNQQAA